MEQIKYYFSGFKNITAWDVIDILLVGFIFFLLYLFVRHRRGGKLAVGLLVLLLIRLVGAFLPLPLLNAILNVIFQVGVLALFIIFQPELRALLEELGNKPMHGVHAIMPHGRKRKACEQAVKSICRAVEDMAASKTGALIVIERGTPVGDYLKDSVELDAEISPQLIRAIFFNKGPLHDGAVVIRNLRVLAASVILPTFEGGELDKELGTRHRAALGLSRSSDAVVIVVSEETGTISLAFKGSLKRNYTYETLRKELIALIEPFVEGKEPADRRKIGIGRMAEDDAASRQFRGE